MSLNLALLATEAGPCLKVDILGQTSHTNWEDRSLQEAQTPGGEFSWRDKNSGCGRTTGIRGLGEPEDTSQKTEDWRKGTETTAREGLESMD